MSGVMMSGVMMLHYDDFTSFIIICFLLYYVETEAVVK